MAINQTYPMYYSPAPMMATQPMYGYSYPQYGVGMPNTVNTVGTGNIGNNMGNDMSMQSMPNGQYQNNSNINNNSYNQNNQNIPYNQNMNINALPDSSSSNKSGGNDIVWVQSDEEVFAYPVAQNCNQMFFDLYKMKMYTKEGSTGLVRDFDLQESPESIQRYQQQQQTQHMQFPIVEATANVVDTDKQADALVEAIERKMEERFNEFENRFSELSDAVANIDNDTTTATTTKRTVGKSMTKKGA